MYKFKIYRKSTRINFIILLTIFLTMLRLLKSLLKQLLFWILFFAFLKLIYLLYNFRELQINEVSFKEAVSVFWYGLKLDLATASYLIIIPFFLILLQSIYAKVWLGIVNKIYTGIIIFFYSLLVTAELGIYEEWKSKLHYKALMYLNNPSEVYNSAETKNFFILLFILLGVVVLSFWIYRKCFFSKIEVIKGKLLNFALLLILLPPFIILGMRGGLQEIPINQSQSYFSKKNILNLAAVNSAFNLYISVHENMSNMDVNPFKVYSDEEAANIVAEIYQLEKDSSLSILKMQKPNIVLIALESWSGTLIESLGGVAGTTPQFHELEKDGVLFTKIYSPGSRSEQGMSSILAGFPSHPISSITVQPDKFVHLKTLTHVLKEKNYKTSFYFGGQLIYGNIKSFIIHNGFDKIDEIYDFPDEPKGKLGVHDEFVFARQLSELKTETEPFFSMIFTSSTHSPFDMPMVKKIDWGDEMNMYLNSAYYTDQSLGNFIREAKKEEWYKNTLFIAVADHSHHSYTHDPYHSKEYHQIPLLFFGEVIKDEFKGTKVDKLGSQTDLIGTLFPQLGLKQESKLFPWSKNLLNPYTPEFAYISFEEGIGWVRPVGDFFYDNQLDYFYHNTIPEIYNDSIVKEGKAFLQNLFQHYMNY